MVALYGACAIVIVVESGPARAAFATYVADGCVAHPIHAACATLDNNFADMTDSFTALVIALNVLPVVVGMFLGAPLVPRELESGTYRFAFTQGTSRTRFVLCAVTMLAAFAAAGAVVLGMLLATWAHPFEVVGVESTWKSGLFDTTWFMLAVWSLLGLSLGILIGTIAKRVVITMAGMLVVVGGLVVASSVVVVRSVISIAPVAATGFTPFTVGGVGTISQPSRPGEGPVSAWLLRSWMLGPHSRVLSSTRSEALLGLLRTQKGHVSARDFLALHHVSYWVSYQPASHLWIFQAVVGGVLLVLGILAAVVAVHRLCELA